MVNFKEGQFGICAEPQQLVSGAHQVSLRAEVGAAQGGFMDLGIKCIMKYIFFWIF